MVSRWPSVDEPPPVRSDASASYEPLTVAKRHLEHPRSLPREAHLHNPLVYTGGNMRHPASFITSYGYGDVATFPYRSLAVGTKVKTLANIHHKNKSRVGNLMIRQKMTCLFTVQLTRTVRINP